MAVWAIGDLHGDVDCSRYWVARTGLVRHLSNPPEEWEWADPASRLVFLGDYIDKGPSSRRVLEFVKRLTDRFPTQVTALMGNHEANLLLDRARPSGRRYLDYVYGVAHPRQYLEWLPPARRTENTTLALHALLDALLTVYSRGLYRSAAMTPRGERSIVRLIAPPLRSVVSDELEAWQAAYLHGVRKGSELGEWLARRPVTARVADTLFVHGGVPPSLATRERVEALEGEARGEAELEGTISELLEYRGLHQSCEEVAVVAARLNVSRVAVGHTPDDTVRIGCGGRLVALDSTLSRWFRASGNNFCRSVGAASSAADGGFRCPMVDARCQGQIVRWARADHVSEEGTAGRSDDWALPGSQWTVHVVDSDHVPAKEPEDAWPVDAEERALDEL
ncbi:hypothetical protein AB1Y20_003609 [Prymnesium parvum]|uniref:Calcineurin-like phosphoesterase domain-containing protein n=1 Tax=Prymnesium parvum TaxID=97485 RepID=A0AB34J6Q0_PRYPA